MSDAKILMEVRGVSKSFGPTVALKNVDITVRAGEIRGLIGENGSGKSTVTSIYAGMQPADGGEMYFLGARGEPASMVDAMRRGVGMIVQETGTIADIPAAENIFLGEEDAFRPFKTKGGGTWGPVNRRALLRRAGSAEKKQTGNRLTAGNITLDLDARNAYKGEELVMLTAKEFDVVEFLMRNAGRVYSREALLDTIWAYEYRSDIRTVDVHIRRLREKLEENPAQPQHILTKWGVGYYFSR